MSELKKDELNIACGSLKRKKRNIILVICVKIE